MRRNLILLALVLPLTIACGGPEKLAPELRLLLETDLLLPLAQGGDLQARSLGVLVWTREAGAAWSLPGFTPSRVWGRVATGRVGLPCGARLSSHLNPFDLSVFSGAPFHGALQELGERSSRGATPIN